MESLMSLLTLLNSLSPLAVIGLLAVIIFMMVKGKTATDVSVESLKENHLHNLPEIADSLRRIETSLAENFSYIKAKLNGR